MGNKHLILRHLLDLKPYYFKPNLKRLSRWKLSTFKYTFWTYLYSWLDVVVTPLYTIHFSIVTLASCLICSFIHIIIFLIKIVWCRLVTGLKTIKEFLNCPLTHWKVNKKSVLNCTKYKHWANMCRLVLMSEVKKNTHICISTGVNKSKSTRRTIFVYEY